MLFSHVHNHQLRSCFKGREECLPPNGYRPQIALTTICPFLTSLWVGQPRLFQPYTSCHSLTGSMTFQSKLPYLTGSLPVFQSQAFFLFREAYPLRKESGDGHCIPLLVHYAPSSAPKSIPHHGRLLAFIYFHPHGGKVAPVTRNDAITNNTPWRFH